MKFVALFVLLVASSLHSLTSAANVNFAYFGQGRCLDSLNRTYDHFGWKKSDIGTLQDCANQCYSSGTVAGTPSLGFYTDDNNLYAWCFCEYSDGFVDNVSPSSFTPRPKLSTSANLGDGPMTSADGGNYSCYSIESGCNARVLAALDRTYADEAVDSIDTASEMLGLVLDNFELGIDAAFGVLDLMQHSVDWVVDFNSIAATDKVLLQQRVSKIRGAWRHRPTFGNCLLARQMLLQTQTFQASSLYFPMVGCFIKRTGNVKKGGWMKCLLGWVQVCQKRYVFAPESTPTIHSSVRYAKRYSTLARTARPKTTSRKTS